MAKLIDHIIIMAEEPAALDSGEEAPVTRDTLKATLEEILRESPIFNQLLAAAGSSRDPPHTASLGAGEANAGGGASNVSLHGTIKLIERGSCTAIYIPCMPFLV